MVPKKMKGGSIGDKNTYSRRRPVQFNPDFHILDIDVPDPAILFRSISNQPPQQQLTVLRILIDRTLERIGNGNYQGNIRTVAEARVQSYLNYLFPIDPSGENEFINRQTRERLFEVIPHRGQNMGLTPNLFLDNYFFVRVQDVQNVIRNFR